MNTAIYGKLVDVLLKTKARRATKYLSPTEVVNLSRPVYRRGKHDIRDGTLIFTQGRPNYRQREFIRRFKKAGESFPIRKIQLQLPAIKS